jgi:hypothetical protein
MKAVSRADVASSFTILKGSLIEESFSFLSRWDPRMSREENIQRWKNENEIGAKSFTWMRDVAFVMSRRFDPDGKDLPLRVLAAGQIALDEWKPILLWHITRDEFVFRDFLVNWLYPAFTDGVYRVTAQDLYKHLQSLGSRGGLVGRQWSETTTDRVAHSLLVMIRDFGLMTGSVQREFVSYHLPERSLVYLLHAIRDQVTTPSKVLNSTDWRMFLMRPSDLEHELLRLHQFHQIRYEVAGSIVELALPCMSAHEYAERMVK